MADAEYNLCEPFGIDNSELDGLSPQLCFVLGVEWQMIAEHASRPAAFAGPVHAENAERLRKVLDRRGRKYHLTYMREDASESWMWLSVAREES